MTTTMAPKTVGPSKSRPRPRPSSRTAAVSVAPPVYGIDFVDRRQLHAVSHVAARLGRASPEVADRNGRLKGAAIGAGVGALSGAAIGFVAGGPIGAAIGTGIGAVVGGGVGALAGGCGATATGVSLGPSTSLKTATKYGLVTPIIVRGTRLADVQDSELVGTSIDHTGSMATRPSAKSNNSGFMPADAIPPDHHTSGIADHLSYYDSKGGDGSYSRLQMDLFKIPSCGINTPQDMQNSGYRLKRTVKKEGSKVVGIITKSAEAVMIGSHSSSKGLTPKRETKVVLRP